MFTQSSVDYLKDSFKYGTLALENPEVISLTTCGYKFAIVGDPVQVRVVLRLPQFIEVGTSKHLLGACRCIQAFLIRVRAELDAVAFGQDELARINNIFPGLSLEENRGVWEWSWDCIKSTDTPDHGYASAIEAVAGFALHQRRSAQQAYKALGDSYEVLHSATACLPKSQKQI